MRKVARRSEKSCTVLVIIEKRINVARDVRDVICKMLWADVGAWSEECDARQSKVCFCSSTSE